MSPLIFTQIRNFTLSTTVTFTTNFHSNRKCFLLNYYCHHSNPLESEISSFLRRNCHHCFTTTIAPSPLLLKQTTNTILTLHLVSPTITLSPPLYLKSHIIVIRLFSVIDSVAASHPICRELESSLRPSSPK